MKSYNLLEDCINNQKKNEYIFKNYVSVKDKKYILSDIKGIKKYYTTHKKCNIYEYVNYDKPIKFFFNIILNNNNNNFEEILNYNINILKFKINDLIIYQEDNCKYKIIHKYYYINNINELNLYLFQYNLINIKIEIVDFVNTILNDNIIINTKHNLEDTLITNITDLLELKNTLNMKIIEKNEKYVENIEFHIYDTIFIKSQMGSGKTTAVISYIKENNIENILIISCRKTLTYSICDKLLEKNIKIENYLKLNKTDIKLSNKLIISPDSIHKINYPLKKFDLIWIDEGVSFLSYLGNHLFISDHVNKDTINIIEWLLKNCVKLLITDADLNRDILKYYLYYRKIEYCILMNYTNFIDTNNYILSDNKNEINNKLKCDLENDNKIYICTDSLKTSKDIYKYICDLSIINIDDILLYNSESDSKYDKEMYNVNKFWVKYKIVIVSPKVVMGIDFTDKYFDIIYAFYNCRTLTCREAFQQIGRIRNLKSQNVYIYLENSVKKEIEDNIVNIKYNLTNHFIKKLFYKKNTDDIDNFFNLLQFKINHLGFKYIDMNNPINYLIIYNLYEKNVNLKNFVIMFKNNII